MCLTLLGGGGGLGRVRQCLTFGQICFSRRPLTGLYSSHQLPEIWDLWQSRFDLTDTNFGIVVPSVNVLFWKNIENRIKSNQTIPLHYMVLHLIFTRIMDQLHGKSRKWRRNGVHLFTQVLVWYIRRVWALWDLVWFPVGYYYIKIFLFG